MSTKIPGNIERINAFNLEGSCLHGMFIIGQQKSDFEPDVPNVRDKSPLPLKTASLTPLEKRWKNISSQDKDFSLTGLTLTHPVTFASYIESTEMGLEEIEKSFKDLMDEGYLEKYKILHFIHDLNERLMPSLHFRRIDSSLKNNEEKKGDSISLVKTFIGLVISLRKCTLVSLKKTLDGLIENMSSSLPSHISIQGILDNDKIISLSVAPTKKDIIFDRDKIRPSPKSPYMSQIHPFNQENSLNKNEGKNEFDLKDLEKVIKDLDEDIHLEDWDVEDARDRSRSKSEGSSAQYNKLLENMLVGSNLESL